MSGQITQFGEAELDSYIRVDRADGSTEFYHVVNGVNVRVSEAQYEQATEGDQRTR